MMVEPPKKARIGLVGGSASICGLVLWNLGLLGSLMLGLPAPTIDDAPSVQSGPPPVENHNDAARLDMTTARIRPLFFSNRSPNEVADHVVGVEEQTITAAIAPSDAIEFRGVIIRDGVLFAVCRISVDAPVALYRVGDELLGSRILEISRQKLVVDDGGDVKTFFLTSASDGSVRQHEPQRQLTVPNPLIIGPEQL